MTEYSMTPIISTRLRTDHNTFADHKATYSSNATVFGDEIWEAPLDGNEVKKGDQWLHVTHVVVDGLETVIFGWMARIHKGVTICNNFTVIDGEVPPPPVPEPTPIKYLHVDIDEEMRRVTVKSKAGTPLVGWEVIIG